MVRNCLGLARQMTAMAARPYVAYRVISSMRQRRQAALPISSFFSSPSSSSSSSSSSAHPWRPLRRIGRDLHTHVRALVPVVQFNLADIGEGIAEAQVLEWHVNEGDNVSEFDPLCDVQSDKATVDITSRYEGKVVKLHYEEGDMALVGKPLVDIETAEYETVADPPVIDATPSLSPTGNGTEPTPPTPPPLPAAAAGTAAAAATATSSATGSKKALMSPAVRNLVREHSLDIAQLVGTGKDGRVLKEDVLNFLEGNSSAAAAAAAALPVPKAAPKVNMPPVAAATAADVVVPVTGIQKAMVKSMTAAAAVPTFGYSDEVQMDAVMAVRSDLRGVAESAGVRLTVLPFLLKGISLALLEHPILNAHVNADCSEMTYRSSHNIGVAMATPNGLLVPNVKDVQTKSVFEIATELARLQDLGAAGKLSQADLTGGTFSLSNIGAVGGTYCRPVLVVPEVCIGAIGRTRLLPRFDEDGDVIGAHIMEASWTADHRVIDGVTVANFSNLWKRYVENPHEMLLGLR
eukprot:UC1_evm3s1056